MPWCFYGTGENSDGELNEWEYCDIDRCKGVSLGESCNSTSGPYCEGELTECKNGTCGCISGYSLSDDSCEVVWYVKHLGCWEQKGEIMEPMEDYNWKGDKHDIMADCKKMTLAKGWSVFCLDDQRNCMSSEDAESTYQDGGTSNACLPKKDSDPEEMWGGPHANSVYKLWNVETAAEDSSEDSDDTTKDTSAPDDTEEESSGWPYIDDCFLNMGCKKRIPRTPFEFPTCLKACCKFDWATVDTDVIIAAIPDSTDRATISDRKGGEKEKGGDDKKGGEKKKDEDKKEGGEKKKEPLLAKLNCGCVFDEKQELVKEVNDVEAAVEDGVVKGLTGYLTYQCSCSGYKPIQCKLKINDQQACCYATPGGSDNTV